METQVKALSVARPAAEFNPCSVDSCEERAAVDLGARPLCPAHFFPACTRELESLSEQLKSQPFDEAAVETFKNFIGACSRLCPGASRQPGARVQRSSGAAARLHSARRRLGSAA